MKAKDELALCFGLGQWRHSSTYTPLYIYIYIYPQQCQDIAQLQAPVALPLRQKLWHLLPGRQWFTVEVNSRSHVEGLNEEDGNELEVVNAVCTVMICLQMLSYRSVFLRTRRNHLPTFHTFCIDKILDDGFCIELMRTVRLRLPRKVKRGRTKETNIKCQLLYISKIIGLF